jgi:hypothetical protein
MRWNAAAMQLQFGIICGAQKKIISKNILCNDTHVCNAQTNRKKVYR